MADDQSLDFLYCDRLRPGLRCVIQSAISRTIIHGCNLTDFRKATVSALLDGGGHDGIDWAIVDLIGWGGSRWHRLGDNRPYWMEGGTMA